VNLERQSTDENTDGILRDVLARDEIPRIEDMDEMTKLRFDLGLAVAGYFGDQYLGNGPVEMEEAWSNWASVFSFVTRREETDDPHGSRMRGGHLTVSTRWSAAVDERQAVITVEWGIDALCGRGWVGWMEVQAAKVAVSAVDLYSIQAARMELRHRVDFIVAVLDDVSLQY
jgi:hypothetical protein